MDSPFWYISNGIIWCKKSFFHVFVVLILDSLEREGHQVNRVHVPIWIVLVFWFFQIVGILQVPWWNGRTCRGWVLGCAGCSEQSWGCEGFGLVATLGGLGCWWIGEGVDCAVLWMDWAWFSFRGGLGLFIHVCGWVRYGDYGWLVFRWWFMKDKVRVVDVWGWGRGGGSRRHSRWVIVVIDSFRGVFPSFYIPGVVLMHFWDQIHIAMNPYQLSISSTWLGIADVWGGLDVLIFVLLCILLLH